MNKEEARDLFEKLIIENECLEWDLTTRHISRGYSIEQVSSNEFTIEVERHPHLFMRSSIGLPSSAFKTVIQTFHLEITTPKVTLIDEKLIDIATDYRLLAEEDFTREVDDWWITDKDMEQLEGLKTKEDAESFALMLFNNLNFVEINKHRYMSEDKLPEDFFSEIIDAQKEVFIERVIEKWEYIKKYGSNDAL